MTAALERLTAFLSELRFEDLPKPVVAQAERCLIDLLGTAAAGVLTPASQIARDFSAAFLAAGAGTSGASLLFDGRRCSAVGASLAGGITIDAIDAHDGHRLVKGHVGCAVLPALLALIQDLVVTPTGREFLTLLVQGYEIGTRAGIVQHASTCDFHSSGSWNSIACAALGARLMHLGHEKLRHALGIAEYYGPRSPMMRMVAHPTMVKDGSGWGAMVGVSAAYLARQGFSGAPATIIESEEAAALWDDLGVRWRIEEQYFKPYPVCRWAHPAIDAALDLKRRHALTPQQIERVEIRTFAAAVALGSRVPTETDAAQYSTAFPVAAALAHGQVGTEEITGRGLSDPLTAALQKRIVLVEHGPYSNVFPAERWAEVVISTTDGRRLASGPATPRGDPECPLRTDELRSKYRALASTSLETGRMTRIEDAVFRLADGTSGLCELLQELFRPPDCQPQLS
ncbi:MULTISPECIES: MmgE/PrpD family protein [unclassified Mesorhizobium]|uniref:MmgE/PrpD family protein n=1 Tax=unclassified Mesorhizobium TaxID=325217 RepID=UPI000FCA6268|nr:MULTISPECIES: MmgE/PrpD family protein [unclassified Mesorhizobium]RUU64863.1 MmgE/PrpD family protein [Mesorhizobium sp. M7A.T.Ca.TU.009.01.1.1]RVD52156.1 MmgE/PrpD family protein [Mesorhizobium sp. M8A.F.Ca.ET.023.02.2.1]TGR36811.1 MmgE/PrpD family protein [bacterium M00.F.Ca.ET.199.01.1.1]TGU17587.1 MmgE/PrpD family protein [bacterium M00.F.Ca.ET.156.01.1.1]TGV81979.1 MmgE/PrpD family protein [Mesorhizobium sp. M00.F.Ca.ET.149.01.1.1]